MTTIRRVLPLRFCVKCGFPTNKLVQVDQERERPICERCPQT